ncbi:hypothetical protein BU25DRAFT_36954 [Macroventuria anomochaeta]|uniref:Uncharacterized protein n=1 Tax=Macroventuria anomochaeta TaxID=301207 RepID=A0ACB6S2J1_9PLEO|nr:uncharacterized protein BU25DRAFT_36954 [Macroventuria anomochaeta]KAF2628490.1 hypothetical protein BU25DRAFT_36954 [Macroventuria anomochaeta]
MRLQYVRLTYDVSLYRTSPYYDTLDALIIVVMINVSHVLLVCTLTRSATCPYGYGGCNCCCNVSQRVAAHSIKAPQQARKHNVTGDINGEWGAMTVRGRNEPIGDASNTCPFHPVLQINSQIPLSHCIQRSQFFSYSSIYIVATAPTYVYTLECKSIVSDRDDDHEST